MLNLNQPIRQDAETVVWKVLIYDKFCQDVISPALLLGDLRGAGVTLHMPLVGNRQPIPDVPAIYFMQPTAQNVAILCEVLRFEILLNRI